MCHIVDAVNVFCPLFIIHVLPLAPDNLNRILRKKESAGRAVGKSKEWTAISEELKGEVHPSQASPTPSSFWKRQKLEGHHFASLSPIPRLHVTGWKGGKAADNRRLILKLSAGYVASFISARAHISPLNLGKGGRPRPGGLSAAVLLCSEGCKGGHHIRWLAGGPQRFLLAT